MQTGWFPSPHSGGRRIGDATREAVRSRILAHAERNYAGKYARIELRFRGALCYVDAYREPSIGEDYPPEAWTENRDQLLERLRNTPIHLCRLRHFDIDRWSVAFYTYSSERYEPCILPNGEWFCTPEECFDIGAAYLQ